MRRVRFLREVRSRGQRSPQLKAIMDQFRSANRRRRRATDRADRQSLDRRGTLLRPANASPARRRTELVDTAPIPGGGELHLIRYGNDFAIQFRSDELMGSVDHASEEALATLVHGALPPGRNAVLIGGLGMGFTLGAALASWGADARITVAELVPQVVDWARGPLAHLFGSHLADPRVEIRIADIHDVIASASAQFDAILLDVDNGPDGFMRPENDRLYCNWGLRAALDALTPGGILGVWSAYRDPAFAERLEAAGFAVIETEVDDTGNDARGPNAVWLATKPAMPGG
jgi:spermidine synthase